MSAPVAVVSGATRGIGRALSRRLIKLDHRVVGLYRTDDAAATDAAADLGAGFTSMRCDVADADAVDVAAAAIRARFGAPRVLVNNAGVNADRPFLEMSVDDWRRVVDTNLTGAFLLSRAIVPLMRAADDPVVVNIGATTGIRPRRNGVNYCASKAGLLQLTKCMALELAPQIRVNCLIPGMTLTDELVTRFRLDDPEALARVLAEIPLNRIGDTDDIADALEFLVGTRSAYLTGQKLVVDGGQFMW
jgi:acetoacetyl-CoA reductase/3-oxoacyl-[acyl-carrier protein] reductase